MGPCASLVNNIVDVSARDARVAGINGRAGSLTAPEVAQEIAYRVRCAGFKGCHWSEMLEYVSNAN